MSTLVTGATGFIGRRLLQSGDRALIRNGEFPGAVYGDLLDQPSLRKACKDIETVFHCAGYAHAFSSLDPSIHWRVNFEGTRNLVNLAGESGVRRFVFLSSVKAMAAPGNLCVGEDWPGEPESAYGCAKRAAEQAVLEAGKRFGMHVVNLRLAMVYGRGGHGNLERMVRGVRAGWFPPLPETGNRRSLVHIDDVIDVIRHVTRRAEANGKTYIVADPCAYSSREIYDAIRLAIGVPRLRWCISPGVLRAGGAVGDMLGTLLRRRMPLNSEAVSRLLDSECYSPERIKRELAWQGRTGLVQGVREMCAL